MFDQQLQSISSFALPTVSSEEGSTQSEAQTASMDGAGVLGPGAGATEETAKVLSHWAEAHGQTGREPAGPESPARPAPPTEAPGTAQGPSCWHAEFAGLQTGSSWDTATSGSPWQALQDGMAGGLAPGFRSQMEERFGENFSTVAISRGLSSQDQGLGVRAVAERERIAAEPSILDAQHRPENQLVLAEELAHIVQKRRGHVVPDALDVLSGWQKPRARRLTGRSQRHGLESEAQTAAATALGGAKPSIAAGARAPARQFHGPGSGKSSLSGLGSAGARGATGSATARLSESPVGKIGAVFDSEANLRDAPSLTSSRVLTKLKFGDRFFAETSYDGWYKVRVLSGGVGYVAAYLVDLAPEPGARLHKIKSGEPAIAIAERYYKNAISQDEKKRDGDLRFYVNVLAYVNPKSIPKPTQDASWKKATTLKDFNIWVPSVEFAHTLRGIVGSGSITGGLWSKVRDTASYVVRNLLAAMPGGNQVLGWLERVGPKIAKVFNHPGQFLTNLMAAVRQGFDQFSSNIVTNMETSIIGLLTDSAAGQGIEMPRRFDAQGILKLSLSVLGISRSSLEQKLIAQGIPASAFQRLEQVGELKPYFADLQKGGIAPVLMKFLEQADTLKETVFGALKNWLSTQVIKQGLIALASILVPGGGLVQLAIKIYDTVMFILDKMKMIAAVVASIADSLANIVDGNIAAAVSRVEQSLKTGLTLALGFLASMAKLGSVGNKVKEVLSSIRAKVEAALNKLVKFIADKAKRLLGKLQGVPPAHSSTGADTKSKEKDEPKNTKPESDPEHDHKVNEGLKQIDVEEEKIDPDKDGKLNRQQAKQVAERVKNKHPIFKKIIAHYQVNQNQIIYEWFASHGNHVSRRKPYTDELEPAADEGTKHNPFPIDWPKPASANYPSLYFGAVRDEAVPQSKLRALVGKPDDKGVVVREYQPHSRSKLPGGQEIGLDTTYYLALGTVVGPLAPEGVYSPGGKVINAILSLYGYRSDTDKLDGDHVHETQLGGPNIVGNLWPLNFSQNRSAGPKIDNHRITLKSEKVITIYQLRQHVAKTHRQYFFKVQSTR